MKKLSVFNVSLVWFGAGISLAEILAGTSLAGLGFAKAMAAVIIGHLIGGSLMFAAGMIGARTGKSAMETVKGSFGGYGGLLFAFLNVLQLVGWTAIIWTMDNITNFLYFIGSVFTPMIGVMIIDFFVFKHSDAEKKFNWGNLLVWLIGFVVKSNKESKVNKKNIGRV